MTMFRKMLGSAAVAAILVTSSAPALARPGDGWGGRYGGSSSFGGYGGYRGGGYGNYGGYGGYRHHRHGNGDGFGNFLLGAIVAGGIVAIASAAAKQSRDPVYGSSRDGRIGNDAGGRDSRDWTADEKEAANVCADTAENVASQRGENRKVDDVDRVVADGQGYRVEGVLEGGRSFICGVKRGEVAFIQFDDRVASR